MYSPCAVSRPRPCTSDTYMRRAAIFICRVSPNSAACLMQFTVSVPALARPSTLAPLDWAEIRKELKSVVPGKGYFDAPITLPPARVTKPEVSRWSCCPNT